MIDVVFLLLVFFVMTFRITPQEGEFAMAGSQVVGNERSAVLADLPLTLRLRAKPNGELLAIGLNGREVAGFAELQLRLIGLREERPLEGIAMTIDCDSNLKYQHVIEALDYVTAYQDANGQKQQLVTTTKFAGRR